MMVQVLPVLNIQCKDTFRLSLQKKQASRLKEITFSLQLMPIYNTSLKKLQNMHLKKQKPQILCFLQHLQKQVKFFLT